jgi:hypothetical protein
LGLFFLELADCPFQLANSIRMFSITLANGAANVCLAIFSACV